ncbi:MAG: DUF3102 domain-containing protein [Oscillospiraceae bacterium]|nr:DUF3102 domain-containing protein [Oscillospiraceae bacterium]
MENEIIEAEYREISVDGETLCEITAEIRYISEQMNRTLISGIIEIGKRFDKAKALVKHGEWGRWCEECTGYKRSMAENYIKVYKEYGGEQYSIFGDLSKSQSIGNLGITKLIELTALPPDEREKFVEDNGVTEDTTVKELQELLRKQKEEISAAENKAVQKEKELTDSIERGNREIEEKDEEIRRLQTELDRRNAEEPTVPQDELEKMMADADEKAKAALQNEIDRLTKEKKKAESETAKIKKRLDALQGDYDKRSDEVKELMDKNSAAAAEKAELQKTIDRLRKESSFGANESIVKLNFCFEAAQESLSAMKKSLAAVKGTEKYDALKNAVCATLSYMVKEMED